MMVHFENYEDRYHEGVLACVRRNFTKMEGIPAERIDRWMEPIFSYQWEPGRGTELPFSRGLVMLADDEVVGFNGFICSYVDWQGRRYATARSTTTAVDPAYRRYRDGNGEEQRAIHTIFRRVAETADVIVGDTAIPSMRRFFENTMGFTYYDRANHKFFAVPCLRRSLRLRFVEDAAEIADPVLRGMYASHAPYGTRCLMAEGDGGSCCVFYRRFPKMRKLPLGLELALPFVNTLEVTDRDYFGAHAHEMIWAIQKRERAFLEADSRFFGEKGPDYPGKYRTYETWRMAWSRDPSFDPRILSGLYSELSILGDYTRAIK